MTVAALARLVKFSHSLFALPFAASAVVLVSPRATLDGERLLLVAVAVVAARTAAMSMNRIADQRLDAMNPRTARRELVTGEVSRSSALALLFGSVAVFAAAAALISPLCGYLSLPVLAVLLGYSYAKRFTWACHLWLGVAQALGPVGVAVALTGEVGWPALMLGLGVGAWIAGFDVFYAMQDLEFDRREGVRSIPARFGVRGGLSWARLLHLAAALLVAAAGLAGGRGWAWTAGAALLAAVLLVEHLYVAPRGELRPERIGKAFFDFNAFASVAFALLALLDFFLTRPA
ncbi:MAG TPA: 4-hydroxybenzoate octaprenyltransferase [Anaeromyxobacteraceae bacterium]|nr:4-hydroxybenzoate octaprenyltransferase [Anaeromyxobacteraceae bacterium]